MAAVYLYNKGMSELMEHLYSACNPWWGGNDFEAGIARERYLGLFTAMQGRETLEILGGSRRTGKSTLLLQFIKRKLEDGFPASQVFYIAFEHPRFSTLPLSAHLENYYELFKDNKRKKMLLVLDEVQESISWQSELQALYNNKYIKTLCSGSSTAFLGTLENRLEGMKSVTTIHTLSFEEYLHFKEYGSTDFVCHSLDKCVEDYLFCGGYPSQVLYPDDNYMADLYKEILAKDVISVFRVQKPPLLKDIIRIIALAVGTRISFNKMADMLKASLDTIKDYCSYLEASMLVKSVEKWSSSPNDRIYAARKFYLYDTGIKTLLSGYCDVGPLAENAVLCHMNRQGLSPCYWAEGEKEVDFVLGDEDAPLPLDVKYIDEFNWHDSMYSGMKLFLRRFPRASKAIIVTSEAEESFLEGNVQVAVIPLRKFLLRFRADDWNALFIDDFQETEPGQEVKPEDGEE